MSGFVENFRNIFKIEELRSRILFTVALLIVVRIGAHITIPGINASLLVEAQKNQSANTLFGLYDLFVGGAFNKAAVFSLGIMPYISASIIIQLLGAVFPYFQKLQKEGEDGRKKINQMTRLLTIPVAALQAWGVSVQFASRRVGEMNIISPEVTGFLFTFSTVIFLTGGTILLMWFGEQITEKGIGNGISLIIFIGIIDRFPYSIFDEIQIISSGVRNIIIEAICNEENTRSICQACYREKSIRWSYTVYSDESKPGRCYAFDFCSVYYVYSQYSLVLFPEQ
jgi:preprotein translocase subunit SecY